METNIIIAGVSLTAITGALTWVASKTGLNSQFLPLASVIIGIIISCIYTISVTGDNVGVGILAGVASGLMASGAYDHIQKTQEIIKG